MSTAIMIDLDFGDPQGEPGEFGIDEGVDAVGVIAAMKESGSIHRALDDWDLLGYPTIKVTVVSDDGTRLGKRSHAEWKWDEPA